MVPRGVKDHEIGWYSSHCSDYGPSQPTGIFWTQQRVRASVWSGPTAIDFSWLSFSQIKKNLKFQLLATSGSMQASEKSETFAFPSLFQIQERTRKTQGYSSRLFYLTWSDLEWWEGNPNLIPTPTPSKTQIFSFCMIFLEQHSSQWTLCYGLVGLKGTQRKNVNFALKNKKCIFWQALF